MDAAAAAAGISGQPARYANPLQGSQVRLEFLSLLGVGVGERLVPVHLQQPRRLDQDLGAYHCR